MDKQLLDLMIDRIESQALAGYYDDAYRGFIEGAIARTILADIANCDEISNSGLKWIAFLPEGSSEQVWYLANNVEVKLTFDWEPMPMLPNLKLMEQIREIAQGGRFLATYRVSVHSLEMEIRQWDYLAEIQWLHIFYTADQKSHNPINGWLVLADPQKQRNQFVPIQSTITRVCRQMRDRLRLVFAAQPSTLRMISVLDRRYQLKVLRVLEGAGLDKLLSSLPEHTVLGAGRLVMPLHSEVLQSIESYEIRSDRVDNFERWFERNRERYRADFLKLVTESQGKPIQNEFAASYNKRLQHDLGNFHGYARCKGDDFAVFEIIMSASDFHSLLVQLVKADRHKKDTIVVCLTTTLIADELERTIMPWERLFRIRIWRVEK